MKFTEEEYKKMQEDIQYILDAAVEIAQKFSDAVDAIMEDMRKTGFIS